MRPEIATLEMGTGPPVLLVHGLSGFKESWGPLPRAIAAEGRRAIAVDLPGWGESPAPRDAPHTAAWYSRALWPLLERVGPAVVLGHSMGCQAAVHLTVARRELVTGLLVVSPQVARRPWTGHRPRAPSDWAGLPVVGGAAAQLMHRVLSHDDARLTRAYVAAVARPDALAVDGPAMDTLARAKHAFRAMSGRDWGRALNRALREDLRRHARALRRPTTVVVGEADRVIDPLLAVELAAAIPEARLVRLPGVGHLPQWEAPRAVVSALVALEAQSSSETSAA